MFFKFLSLHNCIWNNLYLILKGTIFFLIFIRYFISLIRYIFSTISVQSNIFIFNFHSRSFRHIFSFSQPPPKRKRWERVCRNQTNEMEQKKKKEKTKRRKSCNYGGLAHYTHQANQLYVIGIPIEFFQKVHRNQRRTRLELDRFQDH